MYVYYVLFGWGQEACCLNRLLVALDRWLSYTVTTIDRSH